MSNSPQLDISHDGLVAILETIDEGIHAVDMAGRTAVYNRAAGRLDGLHQADVIGKHVLEAFPSLEQSTSTLLQVLESGRAIYNQPQTYTNYLGVKVHTVNTTLPILSSGKVVGALEIAKDLTQVKRLSDQVLDLQAQVAGGASGRKSSTLRGSNGTGTGDGGRSRKQTAAVYLFSHFLTQDPPLRELIEKAERSARTSSPILIYGETGTGKELFVQAIHNASPRRQAPFLAINCAALPASLLEGILFGTVRGSFTGAEDRAGMFELADGGTLFLDEIQSMPLELQAKLLRVLQEGEIMRVGDVRVRLVDVRVIAAMNEQPEAAMQAGQLRPDLYYRINVVRFDLPPLRRRMTDLPLLTSHFIGKWNGRFGTAVIGVDALVAGAFQCYPWPGNIRELENAIESAMNLVTEGVIRLEYLPTQIRAFAPADGTVGSTVGGVAGDEVAEPALTGERVSPGVSWPRWAGELERIGIDPFWKAISSAQAPEMAWKQLQSAFERIILMQAVRSVGGNVKVAAQLLGIPRQTLQYRLKQLLGNG